ncbi:MAG TPA: MerR family transcriptional regulator [Thermodesulfobacteriota bacterium]|nr:MerR family transcriptional regulator [Thermodesulfobacteriota bacterium]
MPRNLGGTIYFDAGEVCNEVGISRSTLFLWLRNGVLETLSRDRNGWRIFTTQDIKILRSEANRIER